ncbi:MAG: S66 peptidase family protein [Nonlabens sp.]|uniref:S66 peptidase family protein n=1 Tax=Nonlabens sp. TaxID=1888209 RepID=UPI003EF29BA4
MNFLAKNAHIRILCTARCAFKKDLKPAQELLESWGLRVSYGKTIDAKYHQMGGDVALRTADFQNALNDDDIDAIWIARGGYGTVQLIDGIDFSAFTSTSSAHRAKADFKKLIIGYSDVTVLHSHLQGLGISTLHTFMPLELKNKPQSSIDSFKTALLGASQTIEIQNEHQLKPQELQAPIIGGNLSILYSLLGYESFPKTDGCFLFIEDIDEYLYHIERMMYGLKRAGLLKNLKGIIVGGMSDMRDHEIPFGKNAQEIITDLTADYDYPIIFNFPAGHVKDNRSLKLGEEMQVSILKDHITFTY